ncbi:MAG: hypothetical protein QXO62_06640 [Thermoproteota archaeon]
MIIEIEDFIERVKQIHNKHLNCYAPCFTDKDILNLLLHIALFDAIERKDGVKLTTIFAAKDEFDKVRWEHLDKSFNAAFAEFLKGIEEDEQLR